MKKLLNWFRQSNRWKHLLYGTLVASFAPNIFAAVYAGIILASTSEYKYKQWGGKWDWLDFGITLVGVVIGAVFNSIIFGILL